MGSENGSNAGSAVYPFTIPDSGRVVHFRKLPYELYLDLKRQHELPPAPMVKGPGGEDEPNPADPEYIETCRKMNSEMNEATRRLILKRCFAEEMTDALRAEVAALKADMAELGVTLEGEDEEIYLWKICIATPEDFRDFSQFVLRRSVPTEEGVRLARESFRAT